MTKKSNKTQADREGERLKGNRIKKSENSNETHSSLSVASKISQSAANLSDNIVEVISTFGFEDSITNSFFDGIEEQVGVISQNIQEFPQNGEEFVILSNGDAQDALNPPETFVSTRWENGRELSNYSPDGYDVFDLADIDVTFEVPLDVEGIAFDYKFASEENPGFLGSQYQDFLEILLYKPDNTVENIAKISGEPVTVDNAAEVSNAPGGSSTDPAPPLPSPGDIAYNAVTELRTVTMSAADFQGESLTLRFRIADASDGVYDSAVLLDNLRFIGEVEKDLKPVELALEDYREAYESNIRNQIENWAQFEADAISEFRDAYINGLLKYWGYRDDKNSAEDVPSDLVSITQTLAKDLEDLDLIEDSSMGIHSFLEEMYENIYTFDPSVQTIQDYYMGTAVGQANYFTVNGQTIEERIADFNSGLDNAEDTIIDVLNQDEFTQSDIQRVVDSINKRADQLQQEAETMEEELVQLQNLILTEDNIDGQFLIQDLKTVVNPLVTTGIVSLGILKSSAVVSGWAASHSTGLLVATGIGGTATAGYGYLGGTAGSGASLGGVSQQQLIQQQMAQEHLRRAATQELTEQTTENFANEVRSLLTDAEITDLTVPDITDAETEDLSLWEGILDNLPFINFESATIGRKTGQVTIENTGSFPIQAPSAELETLIYSQSQNKFINAGLEGDFGEFADVSPILPGESVEIDFTYEVPYEQFGSSFQLFVKFYETAEYSSDTYYSPKLAPDPLTVEGGTFTAGETGESISTDTIAEDVISDGESETFTYEPSPETNQFVIDTSWDEHYIDLNLYDTNGNHTGYKYDTNSIEKEIPGSDYSGRVTEKNGMEWITVSDVESDEYEVEIVAPEVGTVIDNTNSIGIQAVDPAVESSSNIDVKYNIKQTEVPELPARFVKPPSQITAQTRKETDIERAFSLGELNGDHSLTNVNISPSDLKHQNSSETIDSSQIEISENNFTIDPGKSTSITLSIAIESENSNGKYSGQLVIESDQDSVSVDLIVRVKLTIADYADNEGIVQFERLQEAINDWREDIIETSLLRRVVDAWRTKEPVN